MTGYPQIGGGELHFAHVLWGGLILFAGALLPLLFANQWAYYSSALASGIGMGLFIDEVGKFITAENDYFYPLAAPVVYVFFLLVVLLYLRTKRPLALDTRSQLYQVFEDFKEVLDGDLSPEEKNELEIRLDRIIADSDSGDLARLAKQLKSFLEHPEIFLVPEEPFGWIKMVRRFRERITRWWNPTRFQAAMAGGLITWGLWSLAAPFKFILNRQNPEVLIQSIMPFISGRMIRGSLSMDLYLVLLGLQAATGLIVLICTLLLIVNFRPVFLNSIYIVLLISLTILTPLLFYYDQFSTILAAALQFFLLLSLLTYRGLFFKKPTLKS
jgi:hypothetical protein